MDTSFYYRLTNTCLGAGQALDVGPDGNGRLMMAAAGNYSGQFWRLVDLGQGKYALRTLYLGDCFSLDVINDGRNDTPWLGPTGNYTGQSWTLSPWGDGTYKLANDFTGPAKSLDVYNDTHQPFMDTGNHSGQHWALTPLRKIPAPATIPDLDPRGDVYHTEGPTDFSFYARPAGTVRAVMLFVDFSNAPAGATSAAATADYLLGHGAVQRLYHEQSYGKLTLTVDVQAALGWRRMPGPSTNYNLHTFEAHRTYIRDATTLFSPAEINFSSYTLVFIVAPVNATFPLSPAFNTRSGTGALSPSGEVRLAVTFGTDSYSNRYITLVHEVGHLFGLPDLYPIPGGVDDSKAGCWSIMSDIFHSVSFLGWHRHKNGWLDPPRKTYIRRSASPSYVTLSPLSGGCGLSMVVLPIDDETHPSKVFVIEVVQPILGRNDRYWGEGVLVYTVDARVPTGSSPLVILAKKVSGTWDYGYLYEAPYGVGDRASFSDDGIAELTVTVLQKFGASYNVKIEYGTRSWWRAILTLIGQVLHVTRGADTLPGPRPGAPARRG